MILVTPRELDIDFKVIALYKSLVNCDEFLSSIGKRLRTLRINQGLSLDQFANLTGWDKSYISRVECGKQNLTSENMAKAISALHTSPKIFFSTMDEILEGIEQNAGK